MAKRKQRRALRRYGEAKNSMLLRCTTSFRAEKGAKHVENHVLSALGRRGRLKAEYNHFPIHILDIGSMFNKTALRRSREGQYGAKESIEKHKETP